MVFKERHQKDRRWSSQGDKIQKYFEGLQNLGSQTPRGPQTSGWEKGQRGRREGGGSKWFG